MKKTALFAAGLVLMQLLHAQTKVFKEVSEEISTQIKVITQDNTLVGYLAFTRLEKASADSFNYRLTVMDENLNDIGTLNFREENLLLHGVSFEQDVLCLAYLKSPVTENLSHKAVMKILNAPPDGQVLVQFINLSGKILNTYHTAVKLAEQTYDGTRMWTEQLVYYIKYPIQLKNITGKGFCLFYGDDNKRDLVLFDAAGRLRQDKKIPAEDAGYLFTSVPNVYLMSKVSGVRGEGGYRLNAYSTIDSSAEFKYELKDEHGAWLKIISLDNDPNTNQAVLTGCIINPDRALHYTSAREYSDDPYSGVFTLTLGNSEKAMEANYSYWNKEGIPGISKDGLFTDKSFYVRYATGFKDYNGNTVFAGTALVEKRFLGASKYKTADAVFIVQDSKGKLTLDNNVQCEESSYFGPAGFVADFDKKSYYRVVNSDTRTNYMIIDDEHATYIYNVNGKKTMRTIQHKDGKIKTNISPAKEGHIMVAEYNKKEKYTRLSIEAL